MGIYCEKWAHVPQLSRPLPFPFVLITMGLGMCGTKKKIDTLLTKYEWYEKKNPLIRYCFDNMSF